MSARDVTPECFVFSFSSKSEGEPPDVLVEDADGTTYFGPFAKRLQAIMREAGLVQ